MSLCKRLITFCLVIFEVLLKHRFEKVIQNKKYIVGKIYNTMNLFSRPLTPFFVCMLFLISCSKDDPAPEPTSVTDIEGNVYSIVKLGNQTWMAENLRVTKLNDGTPIPTETNNTSWSILTTPAYAAYSHNQGNLTKFGALYNWHAVNTGKLCPKGWHIPTSDEWADMEYYLASNGYNYDGSLTAERAQASSKIAKSLATVSGWTSSTKVGAVGNTDFQEARNKSGFNGEPGGYRHHPGNFDSINNTAYWWTASAGQAQNSARLIAIYHSEANVWRHDVSPNRGVSCRCVKD